MFFFFAHHLCKQLLFFIPKQWKKKGKLAVARQFVEKQEREPHRFRPFPPLRTGDFIRFPK